MDTILNRSGARGHKGSAGGKLSSILLTLQAWQERGRQRHHLANLEDFVLQDMGLSRADALREARKPFWRA